MRLLTITTVEPRSYGCQNKNLNYPNSIDGKWVVYEIRNRTICTSCTKHVYKFSLLNKYNTVQCCLYFTAVPVHVQNQHKKVAKQLHSTTVLH